MEYVQAKNPKAGIELNITDVHGNIADALTDDNRKCVEYIFEAMKELDIEPKDIAMRGGTDGSVTTQSMFWQTLLPEQKLQMDAVHVFSEQIASLGPITHVRFNIFPDGGVSRLRLWGKVAR